MLGALLLMAGPLSAQATKATKAPQQTQPVVGKIGYIDSQRVMAQAPGAQEVRDSLNKAMDGFRQQLQPLQDSLQQLMNEYQQQQSVMTPQRRQQQEDLIRQKQQEFQQRQQALQQQAQQKQQDLMKPITDRIQVVLDDIRRQQGFVIIFDAASSGIITADPSLDLTNEVIQRLQALSGKSK
jgi:outer membrane protein